MNFRKYVGPSTLVSAAFIGPGTVTMCSLAGNRYSLELLWALVFSIFATLVLQEMAARLGWYTGKGLGEAIHQQYPHGILRWLSAGLVVLAILIGNAAYEAGNLTGAIIGLEVMGMSPDWKPAGTIGVFLVILGVMIIGKYHYLERFLILLVVLMAICFVVTAILVIPGLGIRWFSWPMDLDALPYALGLIGTTVVPYNLFLHASIIPKKEEQGAELADIRRESRVAIILGGIISIAIMISAAAGYGTMAMEKASDLQKVLIPVMGSAAKWVIGIGLLAAGLSSAITAPLAAAYALKGLLKWESKWSSSAFRATWLAVLLFGMGGTLNGFTSLQLIQLAQIANAILLPLVAAFLWKMANDARILDKYVNSTSQNVATAVVLLITVLLAVKGLVNVIGGG
ncbi:MAG: divalent metal cation transporter [Bacteroidota bacterium]